MSCASSAITRPARSVDGEARVGRAEVGREHDPGAAVEAQQLRGPPAGGGGVGLRDEQVLLSSASTRWAIVERASPVVLARSPRVIAVPSRTRRSTAPAPAI